MTQAAGQPPSNIHRKPRKNKQVEDEESSYRDRVVVVRERPRQAEAADYFLPLTVAAQAAQQGPHLSPLLTAKQSSPPPVFLDSLFPFPLLSEEGRRKETPCCRPIDRNLRWAEWNSISCLISFLSLCVRSRICETIRNYIRV